VVLQSMWGCIHNSRRRVFPLLLSEWRCCTQTMPLVGKLPSHFTGNSHSVAGTAQPFSWSVPFVCWPVDDMWSWVFAQFPSSLLMIAKILTWIVCLCLTWCTAAFRD
jgi:hypothetical protein